MKLLYTCMQCGHKTDDPIEVIVNRDNNHSATFHFCKDCYEKYKEKENK